MITTIKTALGPKSVAQIDAFMSVCRAVGVWDKAGRYHIRPEFATTTSDAIRLPTRAFPKSHWAHAKTKKYLTALLAKLEKLENPEGQ